MKATLNQTKIINGIIDLKLPAVRLNIKVVMFIQWLVSVIVPLVLLLVYQKYANENGIKLEKGCEGPELPFGMLSGILYLLQLRYFSFSRDPSE